MLNDRRRLWTSIIFIGLFAPFVVLVVLNALTGHKPGLAVAGTPPADSGQRSAGAASATAPAASGDYTLLAAGDGHDLWVLRPVLGENKEFGFSLMLRSPNTGVWHEALHTGPNGGLVPFWNTPTMPRALAVMQTPADHPGQSSPYLFGEAQSEGDASLPGWVSRFFLDRDPSYIDSLPAHHMIKAAAGGVDQLFVITLGPPVEGVRVGEPLHAGHVTASSAAASRASTPPATATVPASVPAPGSMPATAGPGAVTVATSQPAVEMRSPLALNVYWYPPTPAQTPEAGQLAPTKGLWCMLTQLGVPGDDSADVPPSSSLMALLEQNGKLMAFWAGAAPDKSPAVIYVRTLDYRKQDQKWSPSRQIHLADEIQPPSRLFAFTIDHTIYLLWAKPDGKSYELRGGWVGLPDTGDPVFHAIAPMPLDAAGTGISVNDLAVGPSENSIVAIVDNHDDGMKAMEFDSNGQSRSGAVSVTPESPRHDVQVGQNVAMVLVVLMLILALWQWRQKPPPLVLPKDRIVAPLHLRALAFGIDAVLPYVAAYYITHSEGYLSMLENWMGLLANPEELVKSTDLLVFLGIYLAHVTVGELLFGKSLGKAAVGLQVYMVDGSKPKPGAILLRNLVRLPECLVGVVVFYLLISNRRQRLGDMLARTVVLAPQPEPEEVQKK